MTADNLPTLEAGKDKEIRFEIERSPRATRVSVRLWTSLLGLSEKVPTGRGFTLDADRFASFAQAAHRTNQLLGTQADLHE